MNLDGYKIDFARYTARPVQRMDGQYWKFYCVQDPESWSAYVRYTGDYTTDLKAAIREFNDGGESWWDWAHDVLGFSNLQIRNIAKDCELEDTNMEELFMLQFHEGDMFYLGNGIHIYPHKNETFGVVCDDVCEESPYWEIFSRGILYTIRADKWIDDIDGEEICDILVTGYRTDKEALAQRVTPKEKIFFY